MAGPIDRSGAGSSGEKVVVAVGVPYGEPFLREIDRTSPRVEVRRIAQLAREERRLAREVPQDPRLATMRAELDRHLAETEVLFTLALLPNLIARAPRLRWVHFISAGVDHAMTPEIARSPILMTDSSGIASGGIAEYVLGVMLMFAKRFWLYEGHRKRREWRREEVIPTELHGQTVGILGVGAIGGEVARLAKAFGMRVLGARRSATQRQRGVGDVDEMLPPSALHDMLAQSDYVVIALPHTRETERIFGERELRAMKPTAHLINVGRGSVVDEPVLVRALTEGWIAGAGLDVFAREPLPPESKLWDLPNAYITPHVAGNLLGSEPRLVALFCENLRRYMAGEPLKNLVDKELGY